MAETVKPRVIDRVVSQHLDEAGFLSSQRCTILNAARTTLREIGWHDARLASHLDGLRIAGADGWRLCDAAADSSPSGLLFTMAVRALEDRLEDRFERLLRLAEADGKCCRELTSACGWLGPERLRGIIVTLLSTAEPFGRMVGIAACGMHRVDPGLVARRLLEAVEPIVRGRALRAAGEVGCVPLASQCAQASDDQDPECRFWGTWSATLLGERGRALEALTQVALMPGRYQRRAFRLALQAMSTNAGHEVLRRVARDPQDMRWLIEGSGLVGDPRYVPWLVQQMDVEQTARLAGEAFSLITGVNLASQALDRRPPEDFASGPNDDPNDPNVEMDPDEGLPWPDAERVRAWWFKQSSQFHQGQRYFMGALVTRALCTDVLRRGYQRQRILAANYLCLLEPGMPLFNTSAPAWRQQGALQQMA